MFGKTTAALSLPKTRTVRGYEIKRLPIGGYLQAIEALQDLPGDLLTACFPGQDLGAVLGQLKTVNETQLQSVIGSALLAAPKYVIRFVARLIDIGEERLLNDADIGLDGLLEILNAWTEVNRLEDFLPAVRNLISRIRTATGSAPKPSTGSKG